MDRLIKQVMFGTRRSLQVLRGILMDGADDQPSDGRDAEVSDVSVSEGGSYDSEPGRLGIRYLEYSSSHNILIIGAFKAVPA